MTALALFVAAGLAVFVLYPLWRVLITALQVDGSISLANFSKALGASYLQAAIANSLLLGVLAGAVSTVLGFIVAFTLTRTDIPGKKVLQGILFLPVISPPFVSAVSILLLFGFSGVVTEKLLGLQDFNIYGLKGVLFAQVFTFFPVAYMVLRGVLEAIDPALEDAALNLGASRLATFGRVVLPLAAPGIASALLVVFIESLADFGNPLVLAGSQFPTLAVQAYLEITGSFNLPLGATLAVLLLLPSAAAFLVQRYWLERRRFVTVTGKPGRSTVKIVAPAVKWGLFVFCWLLAALVLAFYGAIAVGAFTQVWGYNFTPTLTHLTYALSTGFETVKDTLVVALVVTPVSGLLAMLIAFLVVRGRFAGRSLLELTAILPFALPGTVVGIGYILAFNDRPIQITGTLAILVLSFVFRYMPVGIQSGTALLRGIDPSIEEAARNLGASSLTTFQKVTLPLIAPAFFTGLTFAFIRAMTAISAAIFLVSAKWNLLTVQILSEVGSGRLGVAAAYSLILVAVVMLATGIISLVVRRVAGRSIAAAVGGLS